MRRQCAARRGRHDPAAEIRCGTRQTGDLRAPPAGGEPRPVSILTRGRWSGVQPRLRRAASILPPTSSALGYPRSAAASGGRDSRSLPLVTARYEGAVGCGAEQDRTPNGFRERLGLLALDEGQHAAPESGAHDASAIASRRGPCPLDERIYSGCGHLEIVPQAFVRLLQKPPELIEVSLMQLGHECVHARDLRVHVPATFRIARLRLTRPLVVRRPPQRPVLARIDYRDRDLVRKWHCLKFERGAVEQERMSAAPKR